MEMLKKMSVLGLAMKLVLASVLIASLVLAVAFSQQEVYAQTTKTLNMTVYDVNGNPAAGATCSIITDVNPTPVVVTTDSHGKASVSLSSSASTAYVSCNLGNSSGTDTASLNNNVTNIKVFLH